MPSPDCPTVTTCDLRCVLTVGGAYEITYSATGVGMEPIYFRGLALEKGRYSIPLKSSPPCRDSWKGLTHSNPEHPDIWETSLSDRPAKTLGAIEWKITTTGPSNIAFEATPAACLDSKKVRCESSSMRAVTIEVKLKPIRHGGYACGHALLPNRYRRSPDPFPTSEDQFSWTFTTGKAEKRRWPASGEFCTHASALDIVIVVSGAGRYEFVVENVRSHSSAAEDSMPDRIPKSPFNKLGSTACNAPAGSRKSNNGACGSPSNGSSPASGEIIPMEPTVPVPGEFAGNLVQSSVESSHSRKRDNGGFVIDAEGVAKKKARK